ncbi:hypothetical protein VU12_14230, partial [Desulfobulbus sp. US4]|nr:hypothetical protein [Desulfobulbus sp. US4]
MRNTKLVLSCALMLFLLCNHSEVLAGGQAIKLQKPYGYIGAPIYPKVDNPEAGECESWKDIGVSSPKSRVA